MLRKIVTLLAFLSFIQKPAPGQVMRIDWPEFMARHDLIWEDLPLQWNEGAFTGNGQLGMMIYATLEDNRIDFHIGRQDVTDHRLAPDKKTSLSVLEAVIREDYPRLSIGRLALRPAGKIISGTIRQDLWNAEISGTIITEYGEISFKAFTPYDRMVQIVEVSSSETFNNASMPYKWEYLHGNASAPRRLTHPHEDWSNYKPNPPASFHQEGDMNFYVQPLLAGGDFASAWVEKPGERAGQSTLILSTANEIPASGLSAKVASNSVTDALLLTSDELRKNHRLWWHNFYQKSFLSIPDGRMESFYWIQLYKMATSSRPDGPAVDLFGPYFRISQWGGHWWNLNVQLTYWPVYASNHLELGENLVKIIDENFNAFLQKAENAGGRFTQATIGDFTWLMHNYWMQYAYAGDWSSLQEKWMPKAKRIANSFQKILIEGEDGKYHLPALASPEYIALDRNKVFKNTNYNLALLRWLLNSMIEIDAKTNKTSPEADQWKNILDKLHEYPVDAHGLMIGSDQSVDQSHRHFSHLLALYPLFQLNPDDPGDRDLVDRSVVHWHKIDDGKRLSGYSFTGAGSLYAALGRGDDALANIQHFLTGNIGEIGIFLPNTFYAETYGKSPCFETPMSGATAILELLLQSWGGKIRVYPAVPTAWGEAAFDQLRAQGGFLVSAARAQHKTRWVKVKSLKGEPCIVKIPDWKKAYQVSTERKIAIKSLGNGEFQIDLKADEEILLAPSRKPGEMTLRPVENSETEYNLYGVRKGQNLTKEMVWPETNE
jgi:alpha-L-fucosidase 2